MASPIAQVNEIQEVSIAKITITVIISVSPKDILMLDDLILYL
jgi:hypothetical protein